MNDPAIPKGQRVTCPEGSGSVIETIGDKIIIELENGGTATYPIDDVEDDSSAG